MNAAFLLLRSLKKGPEASKDFFFVFGKAQQRRCAVSKERLLLIALASLCGRHGLDNERLQFFDGFSWTGSFENPTQLSIFRSSLQFPLAQIVDPRLMSSHLHEHENCAISCDFKRIYRSWKLEKWVSKQVLEWRIIYCVRWSIKLKTKPANSFCLSPRSLQWKLLMFWPFSRLNGISCFVSVFEKSRQTCLKCLDRC